jgi:hypothetical protein
LLICLENQSFATHRLSVGNTEGGDGGRAREELDGKVLGSQIEQLVDELILSANIMVADHRACPFRIMCIL